MKIPQPFVVLGGSRVEACGGGHSVPKTSWDQGAAQVEPRARLVPNWLLVTKVKEPGG